MMETFGMIVIASWILMLCVVVGIICYVLASFWKEILAIVLIGASVIGFFMLLFWSLSS
jgi:hypothetical protein